MCACVVGMQLAVALVGFFSSQRALIKRDLICCKDCHSPLSSCRRQVGDPALTHQKNRRNLN